MITNNNISLTTPKRPTFLKVLCIISFIMCGLTILQDSFMVIFSLLVEPINPEQVDPKNIMDQVKFFISYTGADSLRNLIIEVISLTGVFLMWKLKKVGYIIYALAECFIYFQFIYYVVSLNADLHDTMAVGVEMIWPLPFDLAFFIMYATQLKHMTWKLKANAL